jgi:hypothetical protein
MARKVRLVNTLEHDGTIRCGDGCGRVLTFDRLISGRRGPNGIRCDYCVGVRIIEDCIETFGFDETDAQKFRDRAKRVLESL